MCMHHSPETTTEVLNGQWPRKCYKSLEWSHEYQNFCSPFQRYVWKPGVNTSSRTSLKIEEGGAVHHGFHVLLDKEAAERCCAGENRVAVEFICRAEHFVAAGVDNGDVAYRSAVFTELILTEEEYARAVAKGKELPPDEDEDDYDDYDDDGFDDYDDEDDYDEEEEEDDEDYWNDYDDWEEEDDDWEDDDDDWDDEDDEEEDEC